MGASVWGLGVVVGSRCSLRRSVASSPAAVRNDDSLRYFGLKISQALGTAVMAATLATIAAIALVGSLFARFGRYSWVGYGLLNKLPFVHVASGCWIGDQPAGFD